MLINTPYTFIYLFIYLFFEKLDIHRGTLLKKKINVKEHQNQRAGRYLQVGHPTILRPH